MLFIINPFATVFLPRLPYANVLLEKHLLSYLIEKK